MTPRQILQRQAREVKRKMDISDSLEETPEQREARILTARVTELGRNYTLAVNDNERARTDKAASDFVNSFLFREETKDDYWDLYLKESGR